MIKGELVTLSAVEKDDIYKLLEWRNNPELRKNFREFREIGIQQQEEWYQTKVLKDPNQVLFSIRNIEDNELLGCCGLLYIDNIRRSADLSLYIGWDNFYIDDVGFAKESCKLLLEYGFKELGLNKIYVEVYEFDNKKLELIKNIGFTQDGVLREHHFSEGKFWDSYIFSMLSKEW